MNEVVVVKAFANISDRTVDTYLFNPDVEIEDCIVMIGWRKVFDRLVHYKERTYVNIRKIENDGGDDYRTDCLLDCHYYKDHYKMIITIIIIIIIIIIITDLSKQQSLESDPKAIQQINSTKKLRVNATIFFILEEVKETIFNFSQETVRALWIYFILI